MGLRLPAVAPESLVLWIHRSLETLWLLTVVLVPLAFLGRSYGEWSSVIGSFELPKIVLLRTLVSLMAVLWLIEWALSPHHPDGRSTAQPSLRPSPMGWPGRLWSWLNSQPTHWFMLAVALYLASTLISTALSPSISVSLWGDVPGQDSYGAYTVIAYVLLFCVIATHLKTPAQLWRLSGAIVAMGLLVAGYSILQEYGHDFLDLREPPNTGRSSSTLGIAVFAGAVLLMTIPVSLMAVAASLKRNVATTGFWWRVALWTPILAIQILGIIFTLSRGPWLGTAFALMVFFGLTAVFVGWRQLGRPALVLALAGILTFMVLLSPFEASADDNPRSPDSTVLSEASERIIATLAPQVSGGISNRTRLWKSSWRLMIDRPWFDFDGLSFRPLRPLIGYGPDTFRAAYLLESPPSGRGVIPLESAQVHNLLPNEAAHAHNFFMHQGVEIGFLGLVTSAGIFAVVFLVGGRELFRARRRSSDLRTLVLIGLLATMSGRLLEQMAGVSRVSDMTVAWVLLGALTALLTANFTTKSVGEPEPTSVSASGQRNPDRLRRSGAADRSNGWPILRVTLVVTFLLGIGFLTWEKNINYTRAAVTSDEAAEMFRNGQLDASISSLDRAIDLAPDVSTYYDQRASVDRIRRSATTTPNSLPGEIELAEKAYARALKWVDQRPYFYRARLALANSSLELGLLKEDSRLSEQSSRLYRDVATMIPASFVLWNSSAQADLRANQPESALLAIDRSLALTGATVNAIDAWLIQARAYRELGQPVGALEALNAVLRIEPEHSEAYRARGVIFFEMGRYREAIADLNPAIEAGSLNAMSYYVRGSSYYKIGRNERAIQDFAAALSLNPQLAAAFNARGLAHAQLGRLERGIQDFDRAIELDPQLAVAYNNRGFAYRDLGKQDKAIEDLSQAIRQDPQLMMAYYNRALAYILLGEDEDAQQDAGKAVELGFDAQAMSAGIDEFKRRR